MKPEVKLFIEKYNELCQLIAVGKMHRPIYSKDLAEDNNAAFVDFNDGHFQYGGCERGSCTISVETKNWDDCMFYAIKGAAFDLALSYELAHRIENQDFRIIFFNIMIKYMRQINGDWGSKLESELSEIALRDGFNLQLKS